MHIHWIISKNVWLLAGGALGFLAAAGVKKSLPKVRPVVVGAVKEVYGLKEWVASGFEKIKENVEDIVAEAKHAYYKDVGAELEIEPEGGRGDTERPEGVEKA